MTAAASAGRRNGVLAAGKKTEASRRKCAMNSVRHGLTAASLVLSNESMQSGSNNSEKPTTIACNPSTKSNAILSTTWSLPAGAFAAFKHRSGNHRYASGPHEVRLTQERGYAGEPCDATSVMLAFEKESNSPDTLRLCARYQRASAELRRLKKERPDPVGPATSKPEQILPDESNAPLAPVSGNQPDLAESPFPSSKSRSNGRDRRRMTYFEAVEFSLSP